MSIVDFVNVFRKAGSFLVIFTLTPNFLLKTGISAEGKSPEISPDRRACPPAERADIFNFCIEELEDLVSDGRKCYVIRNGRPEMGKITGTGCQLSGIMTAYLTANPDHPLEAAAAAVCVMGLAGEIGWSRMQDGEGNATYRNRIIDAVYNMTGEDLEKGAIYELR